MHRPDRIASRQLGSSIPLSVGNAANRSTTLSADERIAVLPPASSYQIFFRTVSRSSGARNPWPASGSSSAPGQIRLGRSEQHGSPRPDPDETSDDHCVIARVVTRLRYSLCNDITRTAEMRQFTMHPTRYLFIIVMIRTQPRPPWQADIPVYFLDGIAITCCFSKRYQYRQSPCRVRPVPATRGSGQAEHPRGFIFSDAFRAGERPLTMRGYQLSSEHRGDGTAPAG